MKYDKDSYLVIADLQIPGQHPGALDFYNDLFRRYKIHPDNVLNVGDEVDAHFAGLWPKSVDGDYTARQEMCKTLVELRRWYKAFPKMKLAWGNHTKRFERVARARDIPGFMMRKYPRVIHAPSGWVWKDIWKIEGRAKHFLVEHGDSYGGQYPHVMAAMHNGMPTVIGHHDTKCGVEYVRTRNQDLWGMVCGATINYEKYFFEYNKKNKRRPINSGGLVLEGGRWPVVVPYDE